jgi:hypothetical protein
MEDFGLGRAILAWAFTGCPALAAFRIAGMGGVGASLA